MIDVDQDSVFAFVGRGMPAASTRGTTGNYKPLPGKVIEMLDGEDRNVSRAGTKKIVYTARGSDIWVPPFIGLWPGEEMTVDWPCLFVEPIGTPQIRPEVPGSMYYTDAAQSRIVPQAQAAWRCYHPRTVVHLGVWNIEDDEDGAVANWTFEAREVRVGGA